MKKILYRSAIVFFGLFVLILFFMIFSLMTLGRTVYKGDLYCNVGRSYIFFIDASSEVTFSCDNNVTIEEMEPSNHFDHDSTVYEDGKIYFYGEELTDRFVYNGKIYLDGAYNDLSWNTNTKSYKVTSNVPCTFTITVMETKGLSKKSDVYDIVFCNNLSRYEDLRFYGASSKSSKILAPTGEYVDGMKMFEPVVFDFGETYNIVSLTNGYEEIKNGFLSDFDNFHYEIFPYGEDENLILSENGQLIITGTGSGYFEYYSDMMGGFRVPYSINYKDSPLMNLIIEQYQKETGRTITAEEVDRDVIDQITELELNYFPSYFNEVWFDGVFKNVAVVRVIVSKSTEGMVQCYLPSSLKTFEITNPSNNSVDLDVCFYGNQTEATIKINGNVNILGNELGDTFTGFKKLSLYISTNNKTGTVNIASPSATAQNQVVNSVFSEIGDLEFIIENCALNITAGNGYNADYGGMASAGGNAIECKNLSISTNMPVLIQGGNGGKGYDGKDGRNGYFSGETCYWGTDGTLGGYGAHGGFAVSTNKSYFTSINSSPITLRGGDGGNGGKGGNGGNGADVGDLNIFEKMWDWHFNDGPAGNGALGGAGGNSGYSLITGSLYNYTRLIIVTPSVGNAGKSGSGGKSDTSPGLPGDHEIIDPIPNGKQFISEIKSGIQEGNQPETPPKTEEQG